MRRHPLPPPPLKIKSKLSLADCQDKHDTQIFKKLFILDCQARNGLLRLSDGSAGGLSSEGRPQMVAPNVKLETFSFR